MENLTTPTTPRNNPWDTLKVPSAASETVSAPESTTSDFEETLERESKLSQDLIAADVEFRKSLERPLSEHPEPHSAESRELAGHFRGLLAELSEQDLANLTDLFKKACRDQEQLQMREMRENLDGYMEKIQSQPLEERLKEIAYDDIDLALTHEKHRRNAKAS